MLLRPSSALLSRLIQLVGDVSSQAWGEEERRRDGEQVRGGRGGRGVGGRGGVWDDGAPRCVASALGRLPSCARCLFITAVMAWKLVCDHRRERHSGNTGHYYLCVSAALYILECNFTCVCVCAHNHLHALCVCVWWWGPEGAAQFHRPWAWEGFSAHTQLLLSKHTHTHTGTHLR